MGISIMEVYDLLGRLGVTADHTSFFHTSCAIWLCVEQRERLLLVTRWLYPEVAEYYETTWYAVEGSVRRVMDKIWAEHRENLEELAGYTMERQPRPAQFLGLLTASLLRGRAA